MTSKDQIDLISVIIPVYRVEPYLDRCVQSVVGQTFKNLEIILVDDGSPDNCPAMCDAWAERDSRVRVIHKTNGGLSDARNAGMAAATGTYIAFVDSDDWIEPEMLERLARAMDTDGSDIAACTVRMVWEDETPDRLLTVQTNRVLDRYEAQKALLEETLLKQPVWYRLYRAETIRDISFEGGKYHEDAFWSYQAIGNAQRVSMIDYTGYNYFQRADSIMGEEYSLKRLDAVEAAERRCRYIAERFPELESRARIAVVNKCIYQGQMALEHLQGDERDKAFIYLNGAVKRFPLSRKELAGMKLSHRCWAMLAGISLRTVCRLKNVLHVGL